MRSLPKTSHEHHDKIEPHVDRLPELAEMIGRVPPEEFAASFETECGFIVGQLMPHMEAIETTLYGRLEELMGARHSMAPMRHEHEQLRGLFDSLCRVPQGGGRRDARRRGRDRPAARPVPALLDPEGPSRRGGAVPRRPRPEPHGRPRRTRSLEGMEHAVAEPM